MIKSETPIREQAQDTQTVAPPVAVPLDRVVRAIQGDASAAPGEFLEDVTVPKGGE